MHEANAKRNALLLGQFEFLQTRQEAFERLLKVSSIIDRVRWLFNVNSFITTVDAIQVNLLNERKARLEAAQTKGKLKVNLAI